MVTMIELFHTDFRAWCSLIDELRQPPLQNVGKLWIGRQISHMGQYHSGH